MKNEAKTFPLHKNVIMERPDYSFRQGNNFHTCNSSLEKNKYNHQYLTKYSGNMRNAAFPWLNSSYANLACISLSMITYHKRERARIYLLLIIIPCSLLFTEIVTHPGRMCMILTGKQKWWQSRRSPNQCAFPELSFSLFSLIDGG